MLILFLNSTKIELTISIDIDDYYMKTSDKYIIKNIIFMIILYFYKIYFIFLWNILINISYRFRIQFIINIINSHNINITY